MPLRRITADAAPAATPPAGPSLEGPSAPADRYRRLARPSPAPSSPRATIRELGPDMGALLLLAALTVVMRWPTQAGRVLAGLDSLTQFWPWYALLGERLRAGELPGWNPYTVAGAPFAADPLSGWTYLPAMVLFTLLPAPTAATAYLVLHPLLAAVGAYLLARALGLPIAGAFVAGVSYGQSTFLAYNNACCFAFTSVTAWLPFLLLGAELALRARDRRACLPGWSLAGLALSQILAAWLGQGSYYALLVFGSFVLFRLALLHGRPERSLASTLAAVALHGTVPVGISVGLAAAGLLPRLEYNALSSLAGGYAPGELRVGGWTVLEWWQLVWPSAWYAGASTVVLAVASVRVAREWRWAPYLVALTLCLLILAGHGTTVLHLVAEALPGLGRLHPHLPERIMTVSYLGLALLAGAAASSLAARARLGPLLGCILATLIVVDSAVASHMVAAIHGGLRSVDALVSVDLATHYAPSAAARFLRERQASEGPFRFFGYGPDADGLAYTQRFVDPDVVPLGVNNRAVTDRLHDIQGYNAVHLARYDAYLRALNGTEQNYHNADIFESGLASPLLDLLNVRYVVAQKTPPAGSADPLDLGLGWTEVYADAQVRVLDRPSSLPRAWIVHDARRVEPEEALSLLAGGTVDPRRTVLLEVDAPLDPSADRADAPDTATVARSDHDVVEIDVAAARAGMLVLSDAYYPAWNAYVDGRRVPVYVANHAFRAVAVPAGSHRITFRFESVSLRLGVAISLLTATALVILGVVAPLAARVAHRRRLGARIQCNIDENRTELPSTDLSSLRCAQGRL